MAPARSCPDQAQVQEMEKMGISVNGLRRHVGRHCIGYNALKPVCAGEGLEAHFNRSQRAQSNAFVFIVSEIRQVDALKLSLCSLRRTHPEASVLIGVSSSRLFRDLAQSLLANFNATLLILPDEPSLREDVGKETEEDSFSWSKLHLWSLEDRFDALLYLDVGVIVRQDLSHLFALPYGFITAMDFKTSAATHVNFASSSFFMLRPCKALLNHMVALLRENSWLESSDQDFLDWYFKYDRFVLPSSYFWQEHSHAKESMDSIRSLKLANDFQSMSEILSSEQMNLNC